MRDESIFASDAVYVSSETDQALLLKEIYDKLLEHGYVKGDFLAKIIQREEQFPTGLSMKTLGKDLVNPVEFGNMVNPKEKLSVKFLFMLLENNPDGQAKLLSQVMDFLADTPEKQLKILFNLHDPETIYEFLRQKFTK